MSIFRTAAGVLATVALTASFTVSSAQAQTAAPSAHAVAQDDCKNGSHNIGGGQNTVWVCGSSTHVYRASGKFEVALLGTANPVTGHVHVWSKWGHINFDGPTVTLRSGESSHLDWNGSWDLPDGDSVCSAWIHADGAATSPACLNIRR
ncbi:hypothetical protein [Streptomyces sp. 4F14]|uniref:hypothetical protein n=1 Tax=Streptomyces sp. 4F14 TaxID=3394380 RepID=UPI003A895CF1